MIDTTSGSELTRAQVEERVVLTTALGVISPNVLPFMYASCILLSKFIYCT